MNLFPSSLRARLLVFLAVAALPVLGLVFLELVESRARHEQAARQAVVQLSQRVATSYKGEIDVANQFLELVAQLNVVRDGESIACSRFFARLLAQNPRFTNLGLVRTDGDIVCTGVPSSGTVNLADRGYFQQVLASNEFAVGDYAIGRTSGKPSVTVGFPVRSVTGQVQAVVFAGLDLGWLNQLAEQANLPQGSTVVGVDRAGTVVVSYPDTPGQIGSAFPDSELVRSLLGRREGTAIMPGIDGVPRLFAFPTRERDADIGLFLAAGLPADMADRLVEEDRVPSLLTLALTVGLPFPIVWLTAEWLFVQPTRRLVATMRRFSSGDLTSRSQQTGLRGEVGELANTFDQMASVIEQREADVLGLNASLEEKVQERTADLNEANATLAEARRFLEHINAHSPMVIFQIRPKVGRTPTYVSPNAASVLGYSAGELVANPDLWIERIHPEDRHKVTGRIQSTYALAASGMVNEYRFQHRNGQYRWLESMAYVEYDSSGTADSGLGYVLDVTDRKLSEEAQVLARDEADRANQAKSEFLSRMSHELRTPLNIVLGFAELLAFDALTQDQRESVGHIQTAGRHLLDLINDVLDISRIEAGRLILSIEPVSAGESVQELLDLLRPVAQNGGVRLDGANAATCPWNMLADKQRLKQVLLNLGSNAIKFNRPDGLVSVDCSEPREGWLRLAVTDTGIGIQPEYQGRLFQPFVRLDAAERGIEGTGLGLALSRSFVEAMGGIIGFDSVVGEGSTFWIELPRAPDTSGEILSAVDAGMASASELQHAGIDPSGRTLLYIEDNVGNMAMVERLLVRQPSIRLLSAVQGQLGLALARNHRPDLILLDLHLPDLPGEIVLQRLRTMPETARIPVVILTADVTPGQRARLLAAGASDYLTKPVPLLQLLQVLLRYLDVARIPH